MPENKLKLLALTCTALLLAACEILPLDRCQIDCSGDEQALAEQGAVRLGADEVKAYVSGRTEQWVHGGAYYAENGRLSVKWRKVNYKTAWEVSADGTLCYQLESWGRRCHFYMQQDDSVYMLDEGVNIGTRAIYEGNRLQNIKGYEPKPESLRQMLQLETVPGSE